MEPSYEEKVRDLQENFSYYKNFRQKNVFDLQKEIIEYQNEAAEYQAQGDQWSVNQVQQNIKQTEDVISQQQDLMQYAREPTVEDYAYRYKQYADFSKTIQKFVDEDELLCFHGTNIAAARHIFESGSISSGASRLGYHTSFDAKGAISVTGIRMVDTSVQSYMNLVSDMYLPAGCLFVVRAKDAQEYDRAVTGMSIKDVDFRNNPERLVAVVTTPENVGRVREWAQKGGVDMSKVMTFEGFVAKCQQNHQQKETQTLKNAKESNAHT